MREKIIISMIVCFASILCFFSASAAQNDIFNPEEVSILAKYIGYNEEVLLCKIKYLQDEGLDKSVIYSAIVDRYHRDRRVWHALHTLGDIENVGDEELRSKFLCGTERLHFLGSGEIYFGYDYLHPVESRVLIALYNATFDSEDLSNEDKQALKDIRIFKRLRKVRFDLNRLNDETRRAIKDLISSDILKEKDFLVPESDLNDTASQ